MLAKIAALPGGALWRHNVAGDLLTDTTGTIDVEAAEALAEAAKHTRPIIYTHTLKSIENIKILRFLQSKDLNINASCDTFTHVDGVMDHGLPAVVTLRHDFQGLKTTTPAGYTVKVCPAQLSDTVTCKSCGICADGSRIFAVGFIAHGSKKKSIR